MKLFVISLGCDKNRIDTERMLYCLRGNTIVDDPTQADLILINTCAFIERARKEAIDTILECIPYGKKLIVTGCLPQKYADELRTALPEVDAFVRIVDYARLPEIFASFGLHVANDGQEARFQKRIQTTPAHYAYLRIADGCNNHCTYCTIPSIRGKYISENLDALVAEAEDLARCGVRELILVAQDVTQYGMDRGEMQLLALLQRLIQIEGLQWIRLLYCYPEKVTTELMDFIVNQPKMAKYIDIPLQHISDSVLKKMGRRTSEAEIVSLIHALRQRGIAIRSTFIAGFPGETTEDFQKLCDFITREKLDMAGFFAYSKEEGTPAARLPNQLPQKIKKMRERQLAALQYRVVRERLQNQIGQDVTVLYEGIDFDRNLFYGRTQQMAPEIDNRVYFTAEYAEIGNFYKVRIQKVKGYDLYGRVIEINQDGEN